MQYKIPLFRNIPNWDIISIPFWYTNVKVRLLATQTRIKQLREQKGITQLKMAMDLSMNQNTISRYESGARQADYETLIAICDYFNVSIDYILMRTDNPEMNI